MLRRGVCRFNHNLAIQHYLRNNVGIAESTVFQGTLYEYTVVRELSEKLLMKNLEVCGGSYDAGIDIRGNWPVADIYRAIKDNFALPTEIPHTATVNGVQFSPYRHSIASTKPPRPLNVLVQCKAFKTAKLTAKEVRECAGAFSLNVPSTHRNNTLLLLSSPNLLTRDGLNVMNSLPIPLIYTRVSMLTAHHGHYDLQDSGRLQNYYENEYAAQLLNGCGVAEWIKFKQYQKC